MNEFNTDLPTPQRGMTSIEAMKFVRTHYPGVPDWMVWLPTHCFIPRILPPDAEAHSTPDGWSWRLIPCPYETVRYQSDRPVVRDIEANWVGMLHVQGPDGTDFLLFSFLTSVGAVGNMYLVSCRQPKTLAAFAKATRALFDQADKIRIDSINGPDTMLPRESSERLFLPAALREDIEQQVFSFFGDQDSYKRLGIPCRRGLLFVGSPGCGKTMMLRRLIRECHQRYQPTFLSLTVNRETGNDEVQDLFRMAQLTAPAVVILDDMDSLTHETQITRSEFLAQLDGLSSRDGVLILGATNNPAEIDPAIVNRPSRFDRVWQFELPDQTLRREYLQWACEHTDPKTVNDLALRTDGWTFAYLNELRTTAAILALRARKDVAEASEFAKAYELLASQHKSGKRLHIVPARRDDVGFAAA